MTKAQKNKAKRKIQVVHGSKWAAIIAQRTGYTSHYVRMWFREPIAQTTIEAAVLATVQEGQSRQQKIKKTLAA